MCLLMHFRSQLTYFVIWVLPLINILLSLPLLYLIQLYSSLCVLFQYMSIINKQQATPVHMVYGLFTNNGSSYFYQFI